MGNFVYNLWGFSPPRTGETRLGMCGFGARIGRDFAVISRNTPLRPRYLEGFQESGREIITQFGLTGLEEITPYDSMDGSLLLRGVCIPGNACDLFLDDHSTKVFLKIPGESVRETLKDTWKRGEKFL